MDASVEQEMKTFPDNPGSLTGFRFVLLNLYFEVFCIDHCLSFKSNIKNIATGTLDTPITDIHNPAAHIPDMVQTLP